MKAHLHRVAKIWDRGAHNAFTGLAFFQEKWFCTFREAQDHVSLDGQIRVITSSDGSHWSSAALLTSPDSDLPDLRDPKIGATPDGRLMLMGAATSRQEGAGCRNFVWFSSDGSSWSEPLSMEDGVWIWSFNWSHEHLYGVGYSQDPGAWAVTLHRSCNVPYLEPWTILHTDSREPNETALLFRGDEGIALIRRELAPGQKQGPPWNNGTALLARSQAPFKSWTTQDLGVYVGGPALQSLPDGRIVVGGRKVSSQHYMALWELDVEQACLRELMVLPSANDCSYPGLVWHNDRLWVSYYSAHEGKANIYLAEVELS